ncbi:PTS sugar transporter subunit IIA [Enterococcus sp. AZ007]|uniref:PTS sugar transporter subunit IIA n=1 Tax=Enterococcus sp. AZ007 TaxID=2774839 RepID=UPI003F250AA3
MFFNRKKEVVFAAVSGELIKIEDVNDPVFFSKAMGAGFGIEPEEAAVYSPINGKVVSVFPTKHAILLETKKGQPVLVHIGIDTVELNGQGIEVHVDSGQTISEQTLLATVDLPFILEQGKQTTVIIAFENREAIELTNAVGVNVHDNLGIL